MMYAAAVYAHALLLIGVVVGVRVVVVGGGGGVVYAATRCKTCCNI